MPTTAIRKHAEPNAFTKLAAWLGHTTDPTAKSSPTWTSGSGVPSASEPKGSFYTRVGGSGAGQVLYVATDSSGTWVAIAETAATDTLSESTSGAGVTVDGLLIKDAAIRGLRTYSTTPAAITGATTLTLADAGGVFSVSQAAAYDIDLPSPTSGPGCRYLFYLTGPAANNVTITVAGSAATFVGTIVNDITSVVAATGATLTFASGTAALGDTIEIISISTSLYLVRAVGTANGAITVS